MNMIKGFRDFILRGNVIDLAVGVVIGIAFGNVVTALVNDIIMPLIGIPGKADFSSLAFTIRGSTFHIGLFINALIAFVLIAAVVFFLIVQPVNALLARMKKQPPADATTRACPYCLSMIPIQATRCAFCTQEVPLVAAPVGAGVRQGEA